MTPLLLIRHSQTSWNAQNRIQGKSDIALNDAGRAMAKKWVLPEEFNQFDWVSSPLKRAIETARILGHEPKIQAELTEMSWGQWEGENWRALQARLGKTIMKTYGADSLDFCPPDGESPRDLQARLSPWLNNLQVPTIGITHKGIMQAIYSLASGWDMSGKAPVKFHHGYAYLFNVQDGVPSLARMNIPLIIE